MITSPSDGSSTRIVSVTLKSRYYVFLEHSSGDTFGELYTVTSKMLGNNRCSMNWTVLRLIVYVFALHSAPVKGKTERYTRYIFSSK